MGVDEGNLQAMGVERYILTRQVAVMVCVCVCLSVCVVIPFILDVRLADAPAGVTQQEEGHTGFLQFPSVILCLNFFREKYSAVSFPRRP